MDPGLISFPSGIRLTTRRSVLVIRDSTKLSASKLSSSAQPEREQTRAVTKSAEESARYLTEGGGWEDVDMGS